MPFIPDKPITRKGFTPDKKTFGGFLNNVGSSTVRLVEDTAKAILSPKETIKSIYGLGSGLVQLLIPGEQGNEKIAKAVGKFYADRYGGLDNAWNSFYNDPAGVAADLSTVLGIGAGAFKLAGASKAAGGLSKVSKIVDPLNVASKFPKNIKAKGSILPAIGREAENFGRKFATRGMGTPKQIEKAVGVAGMDAYDLMDKYNVWDRSEGSFREAAKEAGKAVDVVIADAVNSGVSPDVRKIIKAFDDEIANLSQKSQTSDKAALAAKELSRRKQMFINAINTNDNVPVLEKVRQIKNDFQGDIPESTFGMPTQEVGKAKGTTKAYRMLIGGIEDVAEGTKQGGREQSALIKMANVAKGADMRSMARQPINFSKLGTAGVLGLIKGVPGVIGGFALEQLANSPMGVRAVSRGAVKVGKTLQKPIKISPKVNNVFKAGYSSARTSRVLSPSGVSSQSTFGDINRQDKKRDNQSNKLPEISQEQSSYQPIIPSVSKPLKVKSNVFKNKSSYGKVPRLKMGSFV